MAGWSDDLRTLAGHLGLDRFALVGESGDAPFTLAAAHRLVDRVDVVALIAAGGPMSPVELVGMKASARIMNWLARNAPAFNRFRVAAMRRELVDPKNRQRALRSAMAAAPDAAHAAATQIEFEAVADDRLRPSARARPTERHPARQRFIRPRRERRLQRRGHVRAGHPHQVAGASVGGAGWRRLAASIKPTWVVISSSAVVPHFSPARWPATSMPTIPCALVSNNAP